MTAFPNARPLFIAPGTAAGGVLASAATTGGALGLVETTIEAGHSANLHVHHGEDEAFYILDGTLDVVCGKERFRAETGAFVFLPRGLPHTFLGVAEASRVLVVLVPGGMEEAFVDPGRFGEIMQRHIRDVGAPLG